MADSQHGRLIVLCGPAGVGKGTVLGRVREQHPEIWLSVSATTRQPRPGEVDGVNYFFMTEPEFLAKEKAGEFLETADVFGLAHYGTPVKPVVEHLERNIPVVLEIDLQGARTVKRRAKELGLEVLTVFIEPPSFEELKRRLIGRGTETPQQQAKRLETAKVELAAAPEFDKRIVNNRGRRGRRRALAYHRRRVRPVIRQSDYPANKNRHTKRACTISRRPFSYV